MPKLTMKQIARANNFAIAKSLDPRKLVEALQEALKMGPVMLIPVDEMEDIFYEVLEVYDADH